MLGALAAADVYLVEPRWPQVSRRQVRIEGVRPFRLVQLSDLHLSQSVSPEMIRHAFQQAIAERPDVVCLTGDYVTRIHGQSLAGYAEIFRELSSRIPTFAVKGNHDGGVWAQYYLNDPADRQVDGVLAEAQVPLLENRSVWLEREGVWLVGVGDLWSEAVDGAKAFAAVPRGMPAILLAHNPDTKDELKNFAWRLMLSGHTHGSQNGLPYLRERYAPVEDKRFIAGMNWWPEGGRWIHTNVGVGNVGGFRVWCRPEVSVIEIEG